MLARVLQARVSTGAVRLRRKPRGRARAGPATKLRSLGGDASRVLGLAGGIEQAGRPDDAVAGLDQVVALEPGQLAQPRDQALVHLPSQLLDPALIDALVAPMGRIHLLLLTLVLQ